MSIDLGQGGFPAWLNDGAVVYNKGNLLLKKELGSTQSATLVGRTQSRLGEPMDLAPNGKSLAFVDQRGLVVEDLASGAQTLIAEMGRTPRFSPNGRWLAYAVNTGAIEVERFPEHDYRVPAASVGLTSTGVCWRRDGKELFYMRADRRSMSVEVVESGGRISFGIPKELFRASDVLFPDVAADGQRFLAMVPEETRQNDRELTVLLNWRQGLKR